MSSGIRAKERRTIALKGDDDVLAVGLSRALELLAMPKRGRGGRTALKDLGKPEGSDETIQVYDGPYGLYVKQGKVNASLPEGKKADEVTLEEAVELLAAKVASKKSSRKSTAKKPAAKKTAAKNLLPRNPLPPRKQAGYGPVLFG